MSARQEARAQAALEYRDTPLTIAAVYARWQSDKECAVLTRYQGKERRVYALMPVSTLGMFRGVLAGMDAPVMLDGAAVCQRTTAILEKRRSEGEL